MSPESGRLEPALPVGEGVPENAVIDLRGSAEERVARLIWTHGTGFIVGCDAKMFAECERRSLFGLPLSTRPRHPLSIRHALAAYNISTQQLLGVFEATTPMAKMLEPNAWAPNADSLSPYPIQIRFRVVAEVLPMPAAELARYLPGSNPVRRVEPHMMQLLCDVMVSASGGAMLVAHRNNIPLPGIARGENGVFAQSMYAGMEDDEVFHAAQRVAGPQGSYLQFIKNTAGGITTKVELRGRGAGAVGGKEDPSQPLYVYIESESEDQFRTAIGHVIELLTKVKGEFMSQQR